MEPKYIVYTCENCGKKFYREVEKVVIDDSAECHVFVKLLPENGSTEIEEFPMCACIGGDTDHTIED